MGEGSRDGCNGFTVGMRLVMEDIEWVMRREVDAKKAGSGLLARGWRSLDRKHCQPGMPVCLGSCVATWCRAAIYKCIVVRETI